MPFVGTIKILAKYAQVRDSFFYKYNMPETYQKEKELYLIEMNQEKASRADKKSPAVIGYIQDNELDKWIVKESSIQYIKLAKEIQDAGLPVEVLKPLLKSIKKNSNL